MTEKVWGDGVWLGMRHDTGEVMVGTDKGVIKVKAVKREGAEERRWNKVPFNSLRGLTWEPILGEGDQGRELRATVSVPVDFDMPRPSLTGEEHSTRQAE